NDGHDRRLEIIEDCLLRELSQPVGKFEKERLNLLSNLIALGKLEIKIAFLEGDSQIGMFHEKMGLMYDKENNIIAFTGSMNESANAFSFNYESIDVFSSWTGEEERVFTKQAAFNAMWGDYEPHIKVVDFPSISKEILLRYKRTNTVDLSVDEREYKDTHNSVNEASPEYEISRGPCMPSGVFIRPYQDDAIISWEQHGFRGIFDMATGTGKTYTALAALVRLYAYTEQRLAVIIVCPYQHLVEQWRTDIEMFGMRPIICYSASSQRDWKQRLQTAVTGFLLGVQKHFCVISTNATFSSDYVQKQLMSLTDNIVLIVDEAHNFGAENLSKMLLPNIPYRLALSATIDRHGDEEGTQKLYAYFGEKCIEYTLKQAIDNDMLTPYYYHPVPVSLNEIELNEYLELTQRIRSSIYADKHGKLVLSEFVKMLLIKRARLVAAAAEKLTALGQLISKYKNDSHMLVYCGAATMRDVDYRENSAPIDEMRQIDVVADLLGNEMGMRISKFSSEESSVERDILKASFAEGKHLQALIAIRCLDEGVNIPSIKTAFILASSTNPKEYIQRRGRVLRKYPNKTVATIYDFITLPISLSAVEEYPEDVLQSVKSLAIREIIRMKDFASISENPSAVDILVSNIVNAYEISFEDEGGDVDV
ncbi:MAG: DEAD/DEAH box helicase family protein, partial [Firmicutes bacterium]|nr:DEAD/DEAH box helicase family protein [Bacillota bacterium]